MKSILIRTLLISILWTVLFYHEYPGLNYLILHGIITAILLIKTPKAWLKPNFAALWIASTLIAIGIFMDGSTIAVVCYYLLIPFMIMSARRTITQIFWIPLLGIMQYIFGIFRLLKSGAILSIWMDKKHDSKLPIRTILFMVPIGLGILTVFCILYGIAQPKFYEMISPILDYINFEDLFYLILINVGGQLSISSWSRGTNPYIVSVSNSFRRFWISKRNLPLTEGKIASRVTFNWVKWSLSIILILFFVADYDTTMTFFRTAENLNAPDISRSLHDTFNVLLISFVLTMFIIFIDRFIFRAGQANYTPDVKASFALLLVLNLALISITLSKDALYILHHGITAKRIGLLLWLGWCWFSIIYIFVQSTALNDGWQIMNRVAQVGMIAVAVYLALPIVYLESQSLLKHCKSENMFDYLKSNTADQHLAYTSAAYGFYEANKKLAKQDQGNYSPDSVLQNAYIYPEHFELNLQKVRTRTQGRYIMSWTWTNLHTVYDWPEGKDKK